MSAEPSRVRKHADSTWTNAAASRSETVARTHSVRRGFTVVDDAPLILVNLLVGGFMFLFAAKSVAAWAGISESQYAGLGRLDLIEGLLRAAVLGFFAMYGGCLILWRVRDRPGGHPARGGALAIAWIWACGIATGVTVVDLLIHFAGVEGGGR
jgi:hypothetical protein